VAGASPSGSGSVSGSGVDSLDAEPDVCAPPLLRTFISGTPVVPGAVVGDASDGLAAGATVDDVGDAGSAALLDDSVDGDSEVLPEVDESDPSSARAGPAPCPVASATPTPSATASAPMRPMCRAALRSGAEESVGGEAFRLKDG
jgi:hypothetical protein